MSEGNSVSRAYEPPICRCGRFKSVHDWPEGTITGSDIENCNGYEQVPLDDTALGQAMNDFLRDDQ